MSLIVRIDVDRPYGRSPLGRHLLSRLSSDLYFPRIHCLGFLAELQVLLTWLNEQSARAYVFFRKCTLPSKAILDLLDQGGHEMGLHLENSRSFETFMAERQSLERYLGREILAVSKHGSGGAKFGLHHYAAYEPEKYTEWVRRASMRVFFGNLEDPCMDSTEAGNDVVVFPSAFWLEPHWRDTRKFSVDWLIDQAQRRDIVLLVHPENVLAEPGLVSDFKRLICTLESKVLS